MGQFSSKHYTAALMSCGLSIQLMVFALTFDDGLVPACALCSSNGNRGSGLWFSPGVLTCRGRLYGVFFHMAGRPFRCGDHRCTTGCSSLFVGRSQSNGHARDVLPRINAAQGSPPLGVQEAQPQIPVIVPLDLPRALGAQAGLDQVSALSTNGMVPKFRTDLI